MKYRIVTNNPVVKKEYEDLYYVEGSYEDVLVKVRDLVYEGVELISHPLGASMRMLYSPYRSIVVGQNKKTIDPFHMEIIENSIMNYKKNLEARKIDWVHADDYALIDNELLKSTLKDLEVNFNKDI
ncbi:GrdX family protein [Clostridium sp. Cult1]|uniref:GrdX family protein n=1 Tax=Clostridium sp. Cult1 TaxID=2079002 RepID=UPI001F4468E9|nr:GrdX family protein [Clostridium sp. Cult1]MCF6462638.1 hypothetical protein [Clostridium sp. Cult1]